MAALADAVLPRWFTDAFVEREPRLFDAIRDTFVHTGDGYAANCDALNAADLREEVRHRAAGARRDRREGHVDAARRSRALAAAIPGAQHVEFDAAHISNIECTDGFNRALLDFPDRVSTGDGWNVMKQG